MSTGAAAVGTVQLDNDFFKVTEWKFPAGSSTGWHRHEMEYVVVPISTGQLRISIADTEFVADLVTGMSYTRAAGVEHDVHNDNDFEFTFIEIERKPTTPT